MQFSIINNCDESPEIIQRPPEFLSMLTYVVKSKHDNLQNLITKHLNNNNNVKEFNHFYTTKDNQIYQTNYVLNEYDGYAEFNKDGSKFKFIRNIKGRVSYFKSDNNTIIEFQRITDGIIEHNLWFCDFLKNLCDDKLILEKYTPN